MKTIPLIICAVAIQAWSAVPVYAQKTISSEQREKLMHDLDTVLAKTPKEFERPSELPASAGSSFGSTFQDDLNTSKARGLQDFDYQRSIKNERPIERPSG